MPKSNNPQTSNQQPQYQKILNHFPRLKMRMEIGFKEYQQDRTVKYENRRLHPTTYKHQINNQITEKTLNNIRV